MFVTKLGKEEQLKGDWGLAQVPLSLTLGPYASDPTPL